MAEFGFSKYDVVPGDAGDFMAGLTAAYEENERQLRAMGFVSSDAMRQVFEREVDYEAIDPTRF